VSAKSQLLSGQSERAAAAVMETIEQFPNYRPAYSLLFEAISAYGLDMQPLQGLLDTEIGNRTVEGQFIYRYSLVEACASLVDALATRVSEHGKGS